MNSCRRKSSSQAHREGANTYTQVDASIQAFINDPDTILTLIANDQLELSLEDLREMESVRSISPRIRGNGATAFACGGDDRRRV